MKIKINLILFILFSSATVKGQEKSDLAQGAYLKAEEYFLNGDNDNALLQLNKSEIYLGKTNSKILYFKINILKVEFEKSNSFYIELQKQIKQFFTITDKTTYPSEKYFDILRLQSDIEDFKTKDSLESNKILNNGNILEVDEYLSSTPNTFYYSSLQERQLELQNSGNIEHQVLISTDYGDIIVKLYNVTPKHRDNFLKLMNKQFYDGLLFNRVIRNFMIQAGDLQSKGKEQGAKLENDDVRFMIPIEVIDTLFHKKGALCAVRIDKSEKIYDGYQFYIVQGQVLTNQQLLKIQTQRGISLSPKQKEIYSTIGGIPYLDGAYTVFGEVTSGIDVIDKIASVETGADDKPLKDVRMKMKLIK